MTSATDRIKAAQRGENLPSPLSMCALKKHAECVAVSLAWASAAAFCSGRYACAACVAAITSSCCVSWACAHHVRVIEWGVDGWPHLSVNFCETSQDIIDWRVWIDHSACAVSEEFRYSASFVARNGGWICVQVRLCEACAGVCTFADGGLGNHVDDDRCHTGTRQSAVLTA